MNYIRHFVRSPAVWMLAFIFGASYITSHTPASWDRTIASIVRFAILAPMIWLTFRTLTYEKRLDRHETWIKEMLVSRENERDKEVRELHAAAVVVSEIADNLRTENARIAAKLAEETRLAAELQAAKIEELGKQIATGTEEARASATASRAAENAANDSKKKLDDTKSEIKDLNKRLLEQGETHVVDVELLTEIQERSKVIEKTTAKSHQILQEGVSKKLVDGGQLDDMQVTGDKSHAILTELQESEEQKGEQDTQRKAK